MATEVIQLDLFINEREQLAKLEEDQFKKNVAKSIRGLFARYNEVELLVIDLHRRMDRMTDIALKEAQKA